MRSAVAEHDAAFNRKAWDTLVMTRTGKEPALYWHSRDAPGPGVELLGPLTGASVSELGCGTGHHLRRWTRCSRCWADSGSPTPTS
ncbi:hypothetical protein GCM10009837_79930 [Streptomyces durmitorensis]